MSICRLSGLVGAAAAVLLALFCHPAAGQAVCPVVEVGKWIYSPEPNMGALLGGFSGGRFLEAKELAPLLTGGEKYRLYTMTGEVGTATGSKAQVLENPYPEHMVQMSTEPPFFRKSGANIFAVGGEFNAQPRLPEFLSTDHETYQGFAAALLKQAGIAKPKVRLTQVIRIDLEGDGVDEVLVAATHYAQGLQVGTRVRPGDYSIVFLRKLVEGRVETHLVAGDIFAKKAAPLATEFRVGALLDLDGDGVLEILVNSRYYEGGGTQVYRLQNQRPVRVLGADWGA
ncbi:MAG: hypothetical protein FJ128_14750 [Deltaproteobacteria bacterium]|nr:hypothetical protein [Deltaproteobacteria bacterium]